MRLALLVGRAPSRAASAATLDVRAAAPSRADVPGRHARDRPAGGAARAEPDASSRSSPLDVGAELDRRCSRALAKRFELDVDRDRPRRADPPRAAVRAARRQRRLHPARRRRSPARHDRRRRAEPSFERARDLVLGAGFDLLGAEHAERRRVPRRQARAARDRAAAAPRDRDGAPVRAAVARGLPGVHARLSAAALARAAPPRARERGRVGPLDGPRARAGRGLRGPRAVAPRSDRASSTPGFEALRRHPTRVRHRRRRRRRQRARRSPRRRARSASSSRKRQRQRRDRERGRPDRVGLDRRARRPHGIAARQRRSTS